MKLLVTFGIQHGFLLQGFVYSVFRFHNPWF